MALANWASVSAGICSAGSSSSESIVASHSRRAVTELNEGNFTPYVGDNRIDIADKHAGRL